MESFFLGETAKYLFLLFDPAHPLNHWDAPFVFSTEGHPLLIPRRHRNAQSPDDGLSEFRSGSSGPPRSCPRPPPPLPFSISSTAARDDVFNAASLAQLPLESTAGTFGLPFKSHNAGTHPVSPSNFTYYPWTLPPELVPSNSTCTKVPLRATFDISFPTSPRAAQFGVLQRVAEGVLISSTSGLRLSMVREYDTESDESTLSNQFLRIYAISSLELGRDEKVFVNHSALDGLDLNDPVFARTRDSRFVDLVFDVPHQTTSELYSSTDRQGLRSTVVANVHESPPKKPDSPQKISDERPRISLFSSFSAAFWPLLTGLSTSSHYVESSSLPASATPQPSHYGRHRITGTLASGPGAAPLPDVTVPEYQQPTSLSKLPWTTIYVHSSQLCEDILPISVVQRYQVLVIPQGGCSLNRKLQNIPLTIPHHDSLQTVLMTSDTHVRVSDGTANEGNSAKDEKKVIFDQGTCSVPKSRWKNVTEILSLLGVP